MFDNIPSLLWTIAWPLICWQKEREHVSSVLLAGLLIDAFIWVGIARLIHLLTGTSS